MIGNSFKSDFMSVSFTCDSCDLFNFYFKPGISQKLPLLSQEFECLPSLFICLSLLSTVASKITLAENNQNSSSQGKNFSRI